jgi:hypothetical protein
VEVGDVEAAQPTAALARVGQVARVAAHTLVAARAEGERALAGEHDHADRGVLARTLERVRELDERLGTERVADLRSVDGDLGDPLRDLVADVAVVGAVSGRPPVDRGADLSLGLRHPQPYDRWPWTTR